MWGVPDRGRVVHLVPTLPLLAILCPRGAAWCVASRRTSARDQATDATPACSAIEAVHMKAQT